MIEAIITNYNTTPYELQEEERQEQLMLFEQQTSYSA
jgi:hypothetical protein